MANLWSRFWCDATNVAHPFPTISQPVARVPRQPSAVCLRRVPSVCSFGYPGTIQDMLEICWRQGLVEGLAM